MSKMISGDYDLALDCLLERIDRVVYHHEQLQQWDAPPLDGPIYEAQVERARLAGGGYQAVFATGPDAHGISVAWLPSAGMPAVSFGFRGVANA
jgi:hypothetical protein